MGDRYSPMLCQHKPLTPNDMTPRLQAILDRLRKPKADTQTATEAKQEDSPKEESPALVLVPFFDCPNEDRFSKYF